MSLIVLSYKIDWYFGDGVILDAVDINYKLINCGSEFFRRSLRDVRLVLIDE